MRLSDVLSKLPKREYVQVDGFLVNKKCTIGQQVNLDIGSVALNYFCPNCDDLRTFLSKGKVSCICVNKTIISIDCVLACNCGANVQIWFLVEAENDLTTISPKVRIIRRDERLAGDVLRNGQRYGEFSALLDKAEQAFWNDLGAGAIVYLRKIYENITIQAAKSVGIEIKNKDGYQRPFKKILTEVDQRCHIIPSEFSSNGYKLFGELSDIVHGEYDEDLGLKKFEPLHRLVIGILENVKNKDDFREAKRVLGWIEDEEANV